MLVSKIKRLYEEKGISIRNLETSIELGNGTISKWDESIPSMDNVLKLCKYFEVTPNEFFEYQINENFLEQKIAKLESKVEELEKSQFDCMKKVHDYIDNSQAIANIQQKQMESLPERLRELLTSTLNEYDIIKKNA